MTQLSEKKFYDEYDNIIEIVKVTRRGRYRKAFKFLCVHFNKQNKPWITPKILQEKICIADRSYSYQILESFKILNLLKKTIRRNTAYYNQINPGYWDEAIKEGEDGMGNPTKE